MLHPLLDSAASSHKSWFVHLCLIQSPGFSGVSVFILLTRLFISCLSGWLA